MAPPPPPPQGPLVHLRPGVEQGRAVPCDIHGKGDDSCHYFPLQNPPLTLRQEVEQGLRDFIYQPYEFVIRRGCRRAPEQERLHGTCGVSHAVWVTRRGVISQERRGIAEITPGVGRFLGMH